MPLIKVRGPAKAPPGSYGFYRCRVTAAGAVGAEGATAGSPVRISARGAVGARARLSGRITARGDAGASWRPRARVTATGAVGASGSATGAVFPNGYAYRRRIIVPKESVRGGAALANYILLVEQTDSDWRSTANGGQVESAVGWDLRVEALDGTRWAHELAAYDPATGLVRLWVKVPSLSATAATEFLVYHGKPGLSASEAQPGLVWGEYLAVWDARTGVDRTGQGRHLTPVSVAAGSLIGDAGDYNGTASVAETTTTPTWGDGLAGIHVEAFASADALASTGAVVSSGPNPPVNGDADLGVLLGANHGSVQNGFLAKVQTSAGASRVESPAGLQAAGTWFLLAVQWRSGEAARLFVGDPVKGGRFVTPANTPAAMTGTTLLSRSGQIRLGSARQSSGRWWDGRIDEVRVRSTPLSEGHLQTQLANYLQPTLFYGLGNARGAQQTNNPPVAVPDLATIAASEAQIDIDVLANDFEPDAGEAKVLTSVSGTGGAWSVVAGKVRFVKPSGFTGPAYATYLMTANGKSCAAGIRVDAGGGVTAPPPTGDFADHNGPTTTISLTEGGVTTVYTVPLFMAGWEKDTSWTGAGVRFRSPRNQRQVPVGTFSAVPSQFRSFMGCSSAFFGATLSAYQGGANRVNTWSRVCGGPPWTPPTPAGLATFNDDLVVAAGDNRGYYQPNLSHNNLGGTTNGWPADKTMAVGMYVTTLPLGCPASEGAAAANGDRNNYYKAWALRLKRQSAAQNNPIIVLRPNHEGQNQDTGLQISNNSGKPNWYIAGLTQLQYNSMMRHFCSIMYEFGPPRLYIVFSPAFQTTMGPRNLTYRSYFTDANGLVGYTGACASFHPVAGRTSSVATAHGSVTGDGYTEGAWYPISVALAAAHEFKVPFFSLENSIGTPFGAAGGHGIIKWHGDAYDKFGEVMNDPQHYGYTGYIGLLDGDMLRTGNNVPCEWGEHKDKGTIAAGPGTLQHTYGGNLWTAANMANRDRALIAMRKWLGHKPTHQNDTIPAAV